MIPKVEKGRGSNRAARTARQALAPAQAWPSLEHGWRPNLEELDVRIVELLREDPQVSNRTIAAQLGVAESTVASRLRTLIEQNRLRVTLQRDIVALGDRVIAHLDIYVEGRPLAEVCEEVANIAEVASVGALMGAPQIIAQLHARDEDHFVRLINEAIAPIRGIERVESIISLKTLKYGHGIARLAGA